MAKIDDRLEKAMREVNDLSKEAKDAGENDLMYAANRAWTQLFEECRKRSIANAVR